MNNNHKLLISISWIMFIGLICFFCLYVYPFVKTKMDNMKSNSIIEQTSSSSIYSKTIRISLNRSKASAYFGSEVFNKLCLDKKIRVNLIHDSKSQITGIMNEEIDLMISTVDELVAQSYAKKTISPVIIAVIYEDNDSIGVISASRKFLVKEYDLVEHIVKSYFISTFCYRNRMQDLVESPTYMTSMKWSTVNDQFGYFGVNKSPNLKHIEDICYNSIQFLIKNNAIKSDPTNGKPNILYYKDLANNMSVQKFNPIDVAAQLPDANLFLELSDKEWDNLEVAKTEIVDFIRGSDKINPLSERKVKNARSTLKNNSVYLTIKIGFSSKNEVELNKKLTYNRAEALLNRFVENGVGRSKIRILVSEAEDSTPAELIFGKLNF